MSSPNSDFEALTPSVATFKTKVSEEVIKVK